jgi:hypothetical protein
MKILPIIILTFLFAWDGGQGFDTNKISKTIPQDSTKKHIDTIMVFNNLKPSPAKQMTRLTEDLVKLNLYKYYSGQNCFIEDDYPANLTDKDYERNTVRYNLTHFVNLNDDRFIDAIVEYWLMPPGASGHCYQPHKAMVVSGTKEYVFVNPDFVDSFFSIDSVKSVNDKTLIFGCDYDCGGTNKCKRKIRVVI